MSFRRACFVGLAFCLAIAAGGASATTVRGFASGVVNDFGNEVVGAGVDVFGLEALELAGQPVRIDFTYDTALAPLDRATTEPDRGSFRTDESTPRWLEMSITLNGTTFAIVDPNFRYAEVFTPFFHGSQAFDFFQLSAQQTLAFDFGQRRQFIDMGLQIEPGPVVGGALPTQPVAISDSALIEHAVNGVTFSINDFDIDPITGETTYERRVGFHVDVDAFVLMPVPEPGTAVLLGMGLAGLAHSKPRASVSLR